MLKRVQNNFEVPGTGRIIAKQSILLMVIWLWSCYCQAQDSSGFGKWYQTPDSMQNAYMGPGMMSQTLNEVLNVGHFYPKFLDQDQLGRLSVHDKILYVLDHEVQYTQSCSIGNPPYVDNSNILFGYLTSGHSTGIRHHIISQYREMTLRILLQYVDTSRGIPRDYLESIAQEGLWEMIPYIIQYYEQDSKPAYLTALMILMKEQKYSPFLTSAIYADVYEQARPFRDGILVASERRGAIISLAREFFAQHLHNTR